MLAVEAGVDPAVEIVDQGVVADHALDRVAEIVIVEEEVVEETKAVIGMVVVVVIEIGIGAGNLVTEGQNLSLIMIGSLEVKAVGLAILMCCLCLAWNHHPLLWLAGIATHLLREVKISTTGKVLLAKP